MKWEINKLSFCLCSYWGWFIFQNVYETYQIVLRCGLHWKTWASKRRHARDGPRPVGSKGREKVDAVKKDKPGKKMDISGQSASSTPRFPSSLFNTPREPADTHMVNLKQILFQLKTLKFIIECLYLKYFCCFMGFEQEKTA